MDQASLTNDQVVRLLEEISILLELDDANPFRVRAYRNAGISVGELDRPLVDLVREETDLTELEFVGKDLAAQLAEIARTGRSPMLDSLRERIPPSILELLRIPGLGPGKAKRLWKELEITTLDQLEEAARAGRIAELKGFGAKTQESLLRRIDRIRERNRESGS